MSKAVWRTAVAGAAVSGMIAGALAVAAPASAHVTVNPSEVSQGGYARVDFRAPTESDTESTTQLEVHFPEDAPVPSASTAPLPGWSVEVTYRTLDEPIEGGHGESITEVVETITWTAENEDAEIQPGQFGEFGVSMGPMPEVDEMYFRALQTYSDESVVRWIELPAEDGEEPESPAPALRLTAGDDHEAGANGDDPVDAASGDDSSSEGGTEAASDESGTATAGVWLGLAGLVAGLAGLALGGVAFVRTRQ